MSFGHRHLSTKEKDPALTGVCALTIMTKVPLGGRVKTRLTPPLRPEEAAALNSCFLQDIATAITAAGAQTRGVGCYTPVGSGEMFQGLLPPTFSLLPQRDGHFGDRLRGAVEDLFSIGFSSVCLIGSDSPTVPQSTYAEAARLLSQTDERLVLGPSEDGGYYLIGMKGEYPRLFEEIAWSTDQVLDQTLARAAEMRLPVQLLPVSFDVDDHRSLQRLCDQLFAPNESEQSLSAPATKAFLHDLIEREGRSRIWPADVSSPAAI
jgi:rSAM/selenodomain-associated transferase 1